MSDRVSAGQGETPREPDPWPTIEWLEENTPRALELCPYKVRHINAAGKAAEGSIMEEATEKAIVVLTEIAEDTDAENDTRVRAACAILQHAESVRQGHTAPV